MNRKKKQDLDKYRVGDVSYLGYSNLDSICKGITRPLPHFSFSVDTQRGPSRPSTVATLLTH